MSSVSTSDGKQTPADAYGVVPNLFKETNQYTETPGAVYVAADTALMNGNLQPHEQQVVLLTMAQYHNSRYDAVVHARMGLDAGLSPTVVDRLLGGDPLRDDRLQALVDATIQSCEQRGWLDPDALQTLQKRGVGRGDLYEIFAFIGMKTFSSFTSHLADPEIDGPLRSVKELIDQLPEEPESLKRQRLFVG
jgi:alkylhydroperoxidase family enzyme